MAFTRPTDYPRWTVRDDGEATDNDVVNPTSSQNNVVEPSPAKKSLGWDYLEYPPRQWFNWLFRVISKWVYWLDQLTQSQGTDISNIVEAITQPVTGLDARIGTLEEQINTPATGLTARVETAESDIDDIVEAIEQPVTGLDARIGALEAESITEYHTHFGTTNVDDFSFTIITGRLAAKFQNARVMISRDTLPLVWHNVGEIGIALASASFTLADNTIDVVLAGFTGSYYSSAAVHVKIVTTYAR